MPPLKSILCIVLLGILALAPIRPASANLLQNGSFETGPDPGPFIELPLNSTAITGWTVTRDPIDYVGTFWDASEGSRSIDLHRSHLPTPGAGGIAQTFATQPGSPYKVTFDMAGNFEAGEVVKDMRVTAAGESTDYSFDVTGRSANDMGWVSRNFMFDAVGIMTTLEFFSLDPVSTGGPALDNVTVTLIPEPGMVVMMMIGIAGMIKRPLR